MRLNPKPTWWLMPFVLDVLVGVLTMGAICLFLP